MLVPEKRACAYSTQRRRAGRLACVPPSRALPPRGPMRRRSSHVIWSPCERIAGPRARQASRYGLRWIACRAQRKRRGTSLGYGSLGSCWSTATPALAHGPQRTRNRTDDRTRRGVTTEAAWAQTEIGPERAAVMPRAVVGRRSQSFQTPGKSGGEAAGTAALTSARAACKAASLVWSREVFSTVPPSPLSLSRTLSAVTLRTSTKSAAVPG